MPAPASFLLSSAQRCDLEAMRDRDPRPYLRERAAALLKLPDGHSARQVALTGLHRVRQPETVAAWRDRFLADGIAGLVQRPRRSRPP
jgi:hypothetical protein